MHLTQALPFSAKKKKNAVNIKPKSTSKPTTPEGFQDRCGHLPNLAADRHFLPELPPGELA